MFKTFINLKKKKIYNLKKIKNYENKYNSCDE